MDEVEITARELRPNDRAVLLALREARTLNVRHAFAAVPNLHDNKHAHEILEDLLYKMCATSQAGIYRINDLGRSVANYIEGDVTQLVTQQSVDSSLWTGRYQVSDEEKDRLINLVIQTKNEISGSKFSNSEKSNVLASLSAVEALMNAPDPVWGVIFYILRSPTLANLTALAALAISIAK